MNILLRKLLNLPRYRLVVLITFVLSLGGFLSSLFAQYILGMNPCVMCIQQRMALFCVVLLSLPCLLLPLHKLWGKTAAAIILSVPALFGAYIAIQQIHLQSLPLDEQPSCGAPWTFRLRNAPLLKLYEPLIRGTGVCGEVHQIFGVSLPVWSVLFFIAVLILFWVMYFKNRKAA